METEEGLVNIFTPEVCDLKVTQDRFCPVGGCVLFEG